jgi:hypothetical protein
MSFNSALASVALGVGFGRLTWHRSYPYLRTPRRKETSRPDLMTRPIEDDAKESDTSADEIKTDGERSLRTTQLM